jgi:dCMP deaminase
VDGRHTSDDRFLELAQDAGARATCDRGDSGCVVVVDGEVLASGWADAPNGSPTCDEIGHELTHVLSEPEIRTHCVRTVHAEQRAIADAARRGVALEGAVFYCTMEPCRSCAMSIVAAGGSKVVARCRYHAGASARAVLAAAGIELLVQRSDVVSYPQQGQIGASVLARPRDQAGLGDSGGGSNRV